MKVRESFVSVVIIDYKTKKLLEELIISIEQCSHEVKEIIIVDNNPEVLQLDINPGIKTIICRPGKNIGFAKGNNRGFEKTSGEFILFLNPDMFLLNDVPRLLKEKLLSDDKIGIIGPKFQNKDGSHQISTRRFPSLAFAVLKFIPAGLYFFKNVKDSYYDKNIMEDKEKFVDTVSTGAFMVRSTLYEKLGGFDEAMFMYGEDAELCKRIRDMGYKVQYYPKAKLVHYGGQSSKLASKIAIISYYYSFYYLFKKHVVGNFMVIFKPLFFLISRLHLLIMLFKRDKRLTWNNKI